MTKIGKRGEEAVSIQFRVRCTSIVLEVEIEDDEDGKPTGLTKDKYVYTFEHDESDTTITRTEESPTFAKVGDWYEIEMRPDLMNSL